MSHVDSYQRLLNGMQQIERAIIELLRARDVKINASNFSWNHGNPFTGVRPELIPMSVRAGTRQTSTVWTLTCVEACWVRIDRPDARLEIARIVDVLAPQS